MKIKFARKIRRFLFGKRGTSEVISSVIMASAVIALGFVVLFFTQQNAFEQNTEYFDSTNNNIATIQEKLIFEYINYNSSLNELTVFLMNSGNSNDTIIDRVYLSNDSWSQSFDNIQLKHFNNTVTSSLDINQEGFFQLIVDLQEDSSNNIKIVTTRGRYFVTTFIT